MIDANALRWLIIISVIIGFTLAFPPIGVLMMFALAGRQIFKLNRWRARRAAERAAARQVYWTPERIRKTYYE